MGTTQDPNGNPVQDPEIVARARADGQMTDLEQAQNLETKGLAEASAGTIPPQPAAQPVEDTVDDGKKTTKK